MFETQVLSQSKAQQYESKAQTQLSTLGLEQPGVECTVQQLLPLPPPVPPPPQTLP